jgi:hypothetical protein
VTLCRILLEKRHHGSEIAADGNFQLNLDFPEEIFFGPLGSEICATSHMNKNIIDSLIDVFMYLVLTCNPCLM